MTPLRIVHLSSSDREGGAALAAHRLHEALNVSGAAQSRMFVGVALRPGPDIVEFDASGTGNPTLARLAYKIGRRITRRVRARGNLAFTLDWTAFGRRPLAQLPPADIHHLHWTTDLLDFRMLPAMSRRAPLVWTLHDMNPFTGGCHYDDDCGRFTAACGACPVLGSSNPADVSRRVLERKERVLAALPDGALHIVTPSRWMGAEARRSRLFGRFDISVIPNGIDTALYCPVDRAAVRARLGIAPGERALLFVSDNLKEGRKGWAELNDALARLGGVPNLRLVTLGRGDMAAMSGPRYLHLGRLDSPEAIRDAYNAADVFVVPSLQDNFPNTVLEALACGTPVVGFRTGGIADAVEHERCGLLARKGDTVELAAHLTRALRDEPLRAAMAAAARERAIEFYGVDRQAQACLQLYRTLLSARAGEDTEGANFEIDGRRMIR